MPNGVPYVLHARWMFLLMAFSCCFVLSSQRINMSIAILNMVNWEGMDNKSLNYCLSAENDMHTSEHGDFNWTPPYQAHVHASYFYGLILMNLPAEIISERYNAEYTALLGMTLSTVSNFLFPTVANWHIAAVMCMQLTKAMGHALVLPSLSVMLGKWIPTRRLIRFMAYSTSGIPIGAFCTVLLGGILCNSPEYRWPYLFYFSGTLGVTWCLFWIYLCYDLRFMPTLTTSRRLPEHAFPRRDLSVPVLKILTSKPFWGYVVVGIACYWMIGMNIFIMPIYFKSVFDIQIEWNGLLSSFPNVLNAFTYLFAFVILRRKTTTRTAIRRLTACLGLSIFATCVVLLTFVKCRRAMGVLLMSIAIGASGFTLASLTLIPLDMSPNFAGILSGIMNTVGAISGCGLPLMLGYFTEDGVSDIRDWEKVFYACGFVTFVSMILFMAYSSCEVQFWNNPAADDSRLDPRTRLLSKLHRSPSKYMERATEARPSHRTIRGASTSHDEITKKKMQRKERRP